MTTEPHDDAFGDDAFDKILARATLNELRVMHEAVGIAIAMRRDQAKRDAQQKLAEARAARAAMKELGIRVNKPRAKPKGSGRKKAFTPTEETTPADQVPQ